MPVAPEERAAAAAAAASFQATGPTTAEGTAAQAKAPPPLAPDAAMRLEHMSPEAVAVMHTICNERYQGIWPKSMDVLDEMVKETEQRLRLELGDPPKAPMQKTWKPPAFHHNLPAPHAQGFGPQQGGSVLWSDNADNMAVDADADFAAAQDPSLQGHHQAMPNASGKGRKCTPGKGKWCECRTFHRLCAEALQQVRYLLRELRLYWQP